MKKELKLVYNQLRKDNYDLSLEKNTDTDILKLKNDENIKEYNKRIDNDICLQFGQNKKDMFVLDVGYPFSICDGICLAITQLYFQGI